MKKQIRVPAKEFDKDPDKASLNALKKVVSGAKALTKLKVIAKTSRGADDDYYSVEVEYSFSGRPNMNENIKSFLQMIGELRRSVKSDNMGNKDSVIEETDINEAVIQTEGQIEAIWEKIVSKVASQKLIKGSVMSQSAMSVLNAVALDLSKIAGNAYKDMYVAFVQNSAAAKTGYCVIDEKGRTFLVVPVLFKQLALIQSQRKASSMSEALAQELQDSYSVGYALFKKAVRDFIQKT